jgi:UDP-N-acetylglucosamine 2-epimerase (non-hydrolysing)
MTSKKKKILSVFGTRPEAIKMAPLVKEIEKNENFQSIVVVTAQHREMLDQVLELFQIKPDYDLNIMKSNQSLTDITANVLKGLNDIFDEVEPDLVLVHGDTTTTFTATLAAYYKKIQVGHIEAGLRSGDIYSPFPEEGNRKLTGSLANFHFAPTIGAKENLLLENVSEENIYVTGNTVIDALLETVNLSEKNSIEKKVNFPCSITGDNDKIILVTAHRRENHGKPLENIFNALLDIHRDFRDIKIVFPVHKNPKVRDLAKKMLSDKERIFLVEPMEYEDFSYLISKSYLVLTDSGGIQEEAPALGKPVLVLRENTERPEAIQAGTVELVGTNSDFIYKSVKKLLTQRESYDKMAKAVNPYGDGKASQRIVKALEFIYNFSDEPVSEWEF